MNEPLGISGRIARLFQDNALTPLLALLGLLLGLFAVAMTPREEEPQIEVTFANVFIPFPGATAEEVEHLVSLPAEQVLSELEGLKHVYSVSSPGLATLTVEFEVGEPYTDAVVRLYNKIYSHQDWLPANLGVGQPLIKPKGIDDVPILALTLWSRDAAHGAHDLSAVAHALEAELKRIPGTRDVYSVGDTQDAVRVLLDPVRMAGYDIALEDLRRALTGANAVSDQVALVAGNREIAVRTGDFLTTPEEVGTLIVGMRHNEPVYLSDVADVRRGADQPERYATMGLGPGADARGEFPAVTLAVAKKPGENAVRIAAAVLERLEQLKGVYIPEGVEATVTRNYGETADDKAKTLIGKLVFATTFVILLVLAALGWREALIVGAAVILTLLVTLFASWAWGFTLNRVSLFALIFSIGILVDDAIVVVENIHRHLQLGGKSLLEAIPEAVDEVGGPTILATLTVIAALLPMAFVTGLMGPYMSPIPINASMGMLISLAVAFVFTPWLTYRVLRSPHEAGGRNPVSPLWKRGAGGIFRAILRSKLCKSPLTPLCKRGETDQPSGHHAAQPKRFSLSSEHSEHFFRRLLNPFLRGRDGSPQRRMLAAAILFLILASLALAGFKLVVLKMLPFDNKSEFQVVVDMPEGTSLEQTQRVLLELGRHLSTVEEVRDWQSYAGTAAPINFNGLVRQYYLRRGANVGDIQVNLVGRKQRDRKSHDIARNLRAPLQDIGRRFGANVKIVEVPPGPPVMAPLVAEVYGLDHPGQLAAARLVRETFQQASGVVDVDDSVEYPGPRLNLHVDRQKAARLGVAQEQIAAAVAAALGGEDATHLHGSKVKYAVPIRLEFAVADQGNRDALLGLRVRSQTSGALVPLSELVDVEESGREVSRIHKDLLPVVFVTGDEAGEVDSPLYGLFDVAARLKEAVLPSGGVLEQFFVRQPDLPVRYSLKWDGEWQITYETFRDMGLAYSVGLVLIYLLVVAQFRSYTVPLIIMAPIPLTVIGVLPGHALLGAQFTATSMIGMIALAGIIVRNSILLVDFIHLETARGVAFEEAVIRAAAVRAKPILLTALAAMLGALFILDDPIFNGLAIALIFGILVSTLLTLLVIPVLYYATSLRR